MQRLQEIVEETTIKYHWNVWNQTRQWVMGRSIPLKLSMLLLEVGDINDNFWPNNMIIKDGHHQRL